MFPLTLKSYHAPDSSLIGFNVVNPPNPRPVLHINGNSGLKEISHCLS